MLFIPPYAIVEAQVQALEPERLPVVQDLLRSALSTFAFDVDFYMRKNDDIAAVFADRPDRALHHLIDRGYFEARECIDYVVDEEWYASQYPDVGEGFSDPDHTDPPSHYLTIGLAEWRAPRPEVVKDVAYWRAVTVGF